VTRLDIPQTFWRSLATVLLIAVATALVDPPIWPHLIDQVGHSMLKDSAPIIVVGVLKSDTLVATPVRAHSEPHSLLQLRRLTVTVENVLKGSDIHGTIAVYYFTWAGGFDGPRPLGFWDLGDPGSSGSAGIRASSELSAMDGMDAPKASTMALTPITDRTRRSRSILHSWICTSRGVKAL